MTLTVHNDELILQQAPERKSLALETGRTNRQMQFASIQQFRNVQRAARPKIQRYARGDPRNMRRDRRDQNDRRIVVDRNAKGRRRLCRLELSRLQ